MDIPALSELFFEILKYKRHKLPSFLKEYGNYDLLKKIILETENKHFKDFNGKSVLYNLMLGLSGYEINKQCALYELPSQELIKGIENILSFLGISKVEELMAGMGLLSCLLQKQQINVKATDGNRWMETSALKKYTDVKEKLLIEYNTENKIEDDVLYIMSWVYDSSTDKDINDFITKTQPKYLLIIEEHRNINKCTESLHKLLVQKYEYVDFPYKQICHKDYFSDKYTKITKGYNIKSSTVLYINREKDEGLCNYIKMFKTSLISDKSIIFDKPVYKCSDEIYIQDFIVFGYLPYFCITCDINKLIKIGYKITNISKHEIPKYLENIEEVEFYIKLKNKHMFPEHLTREKFLEFYNLIQVVDTEGFEKLITVKYLPDWIVSTSNAYKYIYLDINTKNKNWKENYSTFTQQLL
jgi:hypothetical protein